VIDRAVIDTVHVWLIRADQSGPVLARLAALLDEEERRRAGAFDRPGRRAAFVAAHGAAREVLGARLGVPPERLRWLRGPHGKPEVAGGGPPVSLSHSGEMSMLAVTDRRRVGVDLQRQPSGGDADWLPARLAARFYLPEEARSVAAADAPTERARRFARLWARKEACLKVAGGRLVPGLRLAVGGTLVHDPGGGTYRVCDLPAPQGFHAAVALEGAVPYRVVARLWSAGTAPAPDPYPESESGTTCDTTAVDA
jgi:4'-phosphopantetheinyl transferase